MRLAASLRHSLYAMIAVLFGNGALWLAVHYIDSWPSDPQGWATMSMRIHGAAAMAMLVIAGGTVALHATSAWRERKNRASGLALGAALVVMTATGYCLYYVGGESPRAFASLSHWVLGLAAPLLFIAHAGLGRKAGRIRVTTSPSDVAVTPDKNPENATAACGVRR